MADNYLEKKFEDMRARQSAASAKEQRLRQRAWKKRMDAYRKRLELEAARDRGSLVDDATLGAVED